MACLTTTTSGTQLKTISNVTFMLKDSQLGRVVSDEHNRVLEKRGTYKPTTCTSVSISPTEDHHDYFVLEKHEKSTTYDSENYAVVEKRNAHKQPSCNTVAVDVQEDNHNYFVLERHENLAKLQTLTVDKISGTQQENYYDTSDLRSDNADNGTTHTGSTHVYNTFNDFKDDEYDHLEKHAKIPRALESDYNTTDDLVTPSCENTYDHIHQKPKANTSTDNVYGMPRVDNDYDRVSSVNASFV